MQRSESGFSLIELSIVVLVIGVLVGIAVPVYSRTQATSRQRACFSNQRTIEGVAQTYATDHGGDLTALEGVVDAGHPLVVGKIFTRPPWCSAAPKSVGLATADAAHGAYTLDASGTVEPCGFASHGAYQRD